MKKDNLKVNQLVTTGDHVDAQIRTILDINYPSVFVVWFEGDHQCGQWVDASLLRLASRKQLAWARQNAPKPLALPIQ
jgi:hypothetical protein